MPSLRRRRRGRRVIAPLPVALSVVVELSVLIVIRFSREVVRTRAFGGAELAAEAGAVGAVGAEPAHADLALLEAHLLLGVPTAHTSALRRLRHRRNIFPRA